MVLFKIYLVGLLGFFVPAYALALEPAERREILNAIRPIASEKAGQSIRIKVDLINKDGDWAILVGELVAQPSREINWELAENCHPDLDKMLWVVLQRRGSWRVEHVEICAPEPPYWYLKQYGGFVWPCGVYAGFDDLERQCRKEQSYRHKKK